MKYVHNVRACMQNVDTLVNHACNKSVEVGASYGSTWVWYFSVALVN